MRTIDTYKIHQFSKLWLQESLEESQSSKNIVITHHAPSIKSAYASDLEDLIRAYKPIYWIHGHIQTPSRYKIDQTEIICNPHGYIDEAYNGYDKKLIVEIP